MDFKITHRVKEEFGNKTGLYHTVTIEGCNNEVEALVEAQQAFGKLGYLLEKLISSEEIIKS